MASSAMWSLDGKFGKAIEFDGADDYVDFGNIYIIDGASEATVCAWLYFGAASVTTDGVLVSKYQSGSDGWLLWIDDDGGFSGRIDTVAFAPDAPSGTGGRVEGSRSLVTPYTWDHYCGVFKGGEYIRLYKNSILDQENTTSIVAAMDASSYPLRAGNIYPNNRNLIGKLDEVKIYPYALTEDEIKTDYNRGMAAVMGATGNPASAGSATSSNAASLRYCVPGSADFCAPPVGEWKFDEMTGTTTYDTSGNGNEGVFVSQSTSPSWATVGKIGSALRFDGSDDYAKVNLSPSINNLGPLTLEAWVLADSNGESDTGKIMCKNEESGGAGAWSFGIRSNGRVQFTKDFDGATELQVFSAVDALELGKWQNIMVTWDGGNDASEDVNFYINGQEAAHSWDSDGDGLVVPDTSVNLFIGNHEWQGQTFDGLIDQVRIYNYVRTPAQIAWEFNQGKPVAYWKFDECQDGTIYDSAASWNGGTANNGTLQLGSSGVTATGTCASSSNSFWYNGRTGKYNSAGSFDGEDDYVDLGLSAGNLIEGNSYTVSLWFKVNSPLNALDGLISKDATWPFNFTIRRKNVGQENLEFNTNSSCLDSTLIPLPGAWYHFIAIFDSSVGKRIYINGVLDAADNYTVPSDPGGYDDKLFIGFDYRTTENRYFPGLIDDVKIFNYALTAEQVKIEYSGGAVRFSE
jgi:hypothetical protein